MVTRKSLVNYKQTSEKCIFIHRNEFPMEKRVRNLIYLPSSFVPIGSLEQCIQTIRDKAALRIQTAWRGYQCRKAFRLNKKNLQENKAAIIIQTFVREWLDRKKDELYLSEKELDLVYKPEPINESKLIDLQKKIDRWNEENNHRFENEIKFELQLTTTQEKLKSFYEKVHSSSRRRRHCRSLCDQIEAISSLLTDLPSLEMCDQVEINLFHIRNTRDMRSAIRRHKQYLKFHQTCISNGFLLHKDT